jgi:hypothetical protein
MFLLLFYTFLSEQVQYVHSVAIYISLYIHGCAGGRNGWARRSDGNPVRAACRPACRVFFCNWSRPGNRGTGEPGNREGNREAGEPGTGNRGRRRAKPVNAMRTVEQLDRCRPGTGNPVCRNRWLPIQRLPGSPVPFPVPRFPGSPVPRSRLTGSPPPASRFAGSPVPRPLKNNASSRHIAAGGGGFSKIDSGFGISGAP